MTWAPERFQVQLPIVCETSTLPVEENGKEGPEVLAEADRDRRNPAGHHDQETGPAVEEARQWAVSLLEEVVDPAGARKHRPQLGVGEGAGEREESAGEPDQEEHPAVRQHLGDIRRDEEDAGADHRTDGEQDAIPDPEAAR